MCGSGERKAEKLTADNNEQDIFQGFQVLIKCIFHNFFLDQTFKDEISLAQVNKRNTIITKVSLSYLWIIK